MASKLVHNEKKARADEVRAAGPEIPKVQWTKSPNMRKLYFYCAILCVASATTGYDGYVACVRRHDSVSG